MASTRKPYGGCWTCRLRHKKCDASSHPVCANCRELEIQCHSSSQKPEWMDNASKQRDMVQRVKAETKRSAKRRRARTMMHTIVREMRDDPSSTESPVPEPVGSGPPLRQVDEVARPSVSPVASLSHVPEHSELEWSLLMGYLDHVFPLLHPAYMPCILDGGRSWLLVLATRRPAFFHNVVSLTSYFFSIVPVVPGTSHDACAVHTWSEQRYHLDQALQRVQDSLQHIAREGVSHALFDSIYLFVDMMQLVQLEALLTPTENWKIHLDAAIDLFEQIARNARSDESTPILSVVMFSIRNASGGPAQPVWTAAQAAFRFFTAKLLIDDIISSTAFEQEPRLRRYHSDLLWGGSGDEADPIKFLQLEEFCGCETWVLFLIGDIATLGQWKKAQDKDQLRSSAELHYRGRLIEQRFRAGVARLDQHHPLPGSEPWLHQSEDESSKKTMVLVLTRIWAHAAYTYLLLVLFGWQPTNSEMRANIARTFNLFRRVSPPSRLHTLAWPFVVTGCLATEGEQSTVRSIAESMGTVKSFGTMRDALRIIETTWQRQSTWDPNTWDLATCLKSLGRAILLT